MRSPQTMRRRVARRQRRFQRTFSPARSRGEVSARRRPRSARLGPAELRPGAGSAARSPSPEPQTSRTHNQRNALLLPEAGSRQHSLRQSLVRGSGFWKGLRRRQAGGVAVAGSETGAGVRSRGQCQPDVAEDLGLLRNDGEQDETERVEGNGTTYCCTIVAGSPRSSATSGWHWPRLLTPAPFPTQRPRRHPPDGDAIPSKSQTLARATAAGYAVVIPPLEGAKHGAGCASCWFVALDWDCGPPSLCRGRSSGAQWRLRGGRHQLFPAEIGPEQNVIWKTTCRPAIRPPSSRATASS